LSVTIPLRTLVAFAAGLVVATIILFAFQAVTADAAPANTDTTFVPVTPCRLVDTRPGDPNVGPQSTPIPQNDPVTFTACGTGDGGSVCDLPVSATAISTNTTTVNATAFSFVTLYPADAALPRTSNLNLAPGQAATPNAVTTPLSPTGQFNVFNRNGTVDVIIDINGYYRQNRIVDLETRIVELEALTASMSLETFDEQPVVRFSGVNVQIVDGSGNTTGVVNGRGNLIVGYNEHSFLDETRTGSHNLVVGREHTYSSYAGFVAGNNNEVGAAYASVLGGTGNRATGSYSSISGGATNSATAGFSSIGGGSVNRAEGAWSSVSGGAFNTASGPSSSVTGGDTNTASGDYSSVSGGDTNNAVGDHDSILG
jgi:hypothetical protein